MVESPPVPTPAASVIVLRAGESPFEVLMVVRSGVGMFGSLVVFPGGTVDRGDVEHVTGSDPDYGNRAAALRELAEETGLLALEEGTLAIDKSQGDDVYKSLEAGGRKLALESLVMVSRWVTPEAAPRRFDTRFYMLAVDGCPEVRVDGIELVDHDWVTPREALARSESGLWPMILPTVTHLRWLSRRSSIDDALTAAAGADGRTLIVPRQLEDGSLMPIHLPAETP